LRLCDYRSLVWKYVVAAAYIPEIKADKLSILRALRNLVDNALKYGGDDLSQINIGYEKFDEFHLLFIRDDGFLALFNIF